MDKEIKNKMMLKRILIAFLIIIIFLIGCSDITQDHAEWIAKDFVKGRVKFFATDEDEKKDIPQYLIESIDSYKEGKFWVVVIHVESYIDNETKKGDLVVKIDAEGNVVEFNGENVTDISL